MNPKLLEYMDENQIRELEDERGVRRLLGLLREKVGGPMKWLAWRLWGRRRAINKMRKLALSSSGYWRPPIEKEEDRLARHRQHLDSLKVPIPPPDSHDVN